MDQYIKVDVSSTFYWKYILVSIDPRQFLNCFGHEDSKTTFACFTCGVIQIGLLLEPKISSDSDFDLK